MMPRKKMMTVFGAAVLAIGLTACGSSSTTPDPAPEPPPPPPPTDLDVTMDAAAAAAMAAKTASDAAKMSSDDAMAAVENLATTQTNAMAQMYADGAKAAAATAMAEYVKAKAASDAAAAATLASVAGVEKDKAEAAQMAAEAAQKMADDNAMKAMEAAMMELMIDGTMKSVGDSSVDAMAGASSVSTGSGDDARTVVTGLIESMNPKTDGDVIAGVEFVNAVADDLSTVGDETAAATAYVQAAAARPNLTIGKVLDSSDDMARLMLITHYAGTEMVRVFNEGAAGTTVTGTKAGYVTIDDTDTETTDTDNTPLRSEGMFYAAGTGAGDLTYNLEIGATTKPVEVFSYVPPTGATNAGVTQYAVLTTTTTTAGETTYTYTTGADITAAAAQDGPDDGVLPEQVEVTSGIPAAVEYQHIHFGAWAGLGEAAKDGAQKVADLGIGFVQSVGDGMTGADMPNSGMADYEGNWAATVRRANSIGAGDISLMSGEATLEANFAKATIEATLTGLATLEGAIDGSMFSGTKATATGGGLSTSGTFTGDFSGGFYGAKAAEAAGIFDFTSKDMKAGEFRGAFGGVKDE